MRFTTLPQLLAYYYSERYGTSRGDKIDIIGAFLETHALTDLYQATLEADVIRPEHHLELPFAQLEAPVGDDDHSSILASLHARARIFTGVRNYEVVSVDMPLRGLPSATGSVHETVNADLLCSAPEGLAIGLVPHEDTHPLIALAEGLHQLAHLNKPQVTEKLRAAFAGFDNVSADAPLDGVVIIAPQSYYERFSESDTERRSGWNNRSVMGHCLEQCNGRGLAVQLLKIDGAWRSNLHSLAHANYALSGGKQSTATDS